MAATPTGVAAELLPYEREDELESKRCPDCGEAVRSTQSQDWCVRCAQPVRTTHPTGKAPKDRTRLENRFWEKVDIRERDQCWPWTGCTDRHGYGMLWFDGGSIRAHRIAVMLDMGFDTVDDIPGNTIRHSCDNQCCNPNHLIPGDGRENHIDAIVRGDRDTQFDAEDIREIRRLRGEKTQYEIADEFGTTQQMISKIQRHERYDWVDDE